MSRRVRGFAEGVAGQAIALVAAFTLVVAFGDAAPDFLMALPVAALVIGCGVPAYRHGRYGAAGGAVVWLAVTAALFIVADNNTDAVESGLGYFFIGWVLFVLPVEAVTVVVALLLRRALGAGPGQAAFQNGPARATGWQSAQMSAGKRREPPRNGQG